MSIDTKRIRISGTAITVRGNDIDTDRIIPARYLRCVTFDDLGAHAFEDDRIQLKAKSQTHAFDEPKFQGANVLFVNKNFGCGSSREHAPQAIMRWNKGIAAVIGESFAEIFFGNCISLGVPCAVVDGATMQKLMSLNEENPNTAFTLDVEARTLSFAGESVPVEIPDGARMQFIEGRWDSTAELLEGKDAIAKTATNLPYFNHWK